MRVRAGKLLNNDNLPITIGTFHSLCARILRNEAKYLNLSSQFVIYDVQDQVDLLKILLKTLNVSKNILTPNRARNMISSLKNKIITQIKS